MLYHFEFEEDVILYPFRIQAYCKVQHMPALITQET